MSVVYKEWNLQLINMRKNVDIDDDAGVCNVLTAGDPAEITLYSDERGTSQANPLTISNGRIRFFTLSTITSVDLSIYTANGEAAFVQDVVRSDHRVLIDTDKLEQTLVIPWFFNNNVETDTGFTLIGDVLIKDIRLLVTTVDATETIDIGLDGTTTNDPNGLVAAALTSAAGYVELKPQITDGTNIDYVGSNYVGALLATSITGADAVATVGGWTKLETLIGAAETDANVTYTCSAGSDTAAGYMILHLMKIPL
jgi:hypothetical protein